MQSTDHIYRCNQCIFLLYMFIQKQTELHIFYKYIYVLDHFHEKFILCYTKQQSQRQYQLLLILNLIGATKNKWKLLISIWERHKGNLYSKEKRLKWIISPETRRWRVETENSSHTPTPNKGRKMILKHHAQSFKQWKGSLNPN